MEKEILGFHSSLPLMKELKSEALRCVAWRKRILHVVCPCCILPCHLRLLLWTLSRMVRSAFSPH